MEWDCGGNRFHAILAEASKERKERWALNDWNGLSFLLLTHFKLTFILKVR
jgi:hypothetical protein